MSSSSGVCSQYVHQYVQYTGLVTGAAYATFTFNLSRHNAVLENVDNSHGKAYVRTTPGMRQAFTRWHTSF